jgi:hypothetical protein
VSPSGWRPTKSQKLLCADWPCGTSLCGSGLTACTKSGNLIASWMKNTGMLFPTISQLPSSVYIFTANPRTSRTVSCQRRDRVSRFQATREDGNTHRAAARALDGAEADEDGRAARRIGEHGRIGVLARAVVVDLEIAVRAGAARMHDALGDALVVEPHDLLARDLVLEQRRPRRRAVLDLQPVGGRSASASLICDKRRSPVIWVLDLSAIVRALGRVARRRVLDVLLQVGDLLGRSRAGDDLLHGLFQSRRHDVAAVPVRRSVARPTAALAIIYSIFAYDGDARPTSWPIQHGGTERHLESRGASARYNLIAPAPEPISARGMINPADHLPVRVRRGRTLRPNVTGSTHVPTTIRTFMNP